MIIEIINYKLAFSLTLGAHGAPPSPNHVGDFEAGFEFELLFYVIDTCIVYLNISHVFYR